MHDHAEHERGETERPQLGQARVRHAGQRHGREEIDRIPQASLHDEPVHERGSRHREAADEASFDSGRVRLDLDGHPGAMTALADAGALDGRARRDDGRRAQLERLHGDPLHALLGKNLTPPADCGDQRKRDAHHAHGGVGDEAAEGQRDPERQDHRPRRRRRQLDIVGRLDVSVARGCHMRSKARRPRSSGR